MLKSHEANHNDSRGLTNGYLSNKVMKQKEVLDVQELFVACVPQTDKWHVLPGLLQQAGKAILGQSQLSPLICICSIENTRFAGRFVF